MPLVILAITLMRTGAEGMSGDRAHALGKCDAKAGRFTDYARATIRETGFRCDIRREFILLSAQPRLDVEFSLIARRQLGTLCVVLFANFSLVTPVMRAVPAPVR
jgi:hypothetical protein